LTCSVAYTVGESVLVMGNAADQTDQIWAEIPPLQEMLLACASRLFKDKGCFGVDSMLPGTGMSAQDLAAKTILNIIEGGYWNPESSGVDMFPLAYRIMKRDFLDLIKRTEYKQTEITESIESNHDQHDVENLPSPDNGFQAADAALLVNSLKRLLGHDEMAKAYLDVWLVQGLDSLEDKARALGVSEREVTDIRRRLVYKTNLWARVFRNVRPGREKKV
jgi:hypothetical protein